MEMEWIKTKEAIELCKENGRDISRPGILYAGLTHKFAEKDMDGVHWRYFKPFLLKWLNSANIGEEWETVQQTAVRYNVHVAKIYRILNSSNIERRKFKNAVVFKREEFDEYYEKYTGSNNERKKGK